jgi:hypothetical protein
MSSQQPEKQWIVQYVGQKSGQLYTWMDVPGADVYEAREYVFGMLPEELLEEGYDVMGVIRDVGL